MKDDKTPPPILHDLTSVGDAFVELYTEDNSLPEAAQFERRLAGTAALTAIYHSMLGGSTACIACVGADALGNFVQNSLRKHKVEAGNIQFCRDFPTTLRFSAKVGRMYQTAHYRLADWNLHNTKEHILQAQSSRIVFCNGSVLTKNPARHSIFEILRLSKKWSSTTVFRPVYEPSQWPDRQDAQATIKKTLQFADILTPTIEDAEALFGKAPKEEHLKQYHDMGAKTVVMNLGKQGALLSDGSKVVRVPAVESEVVDMEGVDEAWHAAFFYALNKRKAAPNAVYFANTVAAWVISRPGGLIELPPPGEITKELIGKDFEDI
jgi:sugar/nucleoside kinase (ribokinase family)